MPERLDPKSRWASAPRGAAVFSGLLLQEATDNITNSAPVAALTRAGQRDSIAPSVSGRGLTGRRYSETVRSPNRRAVSALLWVLAFAAAELRMLIAIENLVPLGMDWRRVESQHMLDFRDTVVLPGRFTWSGGNPYDPATYVAAHPWAQEFDPYAPSWLTVTSPLALLPHRLGAVIFLLLLFALLVFFVISLCLWLAPRFTWWLAPVLVIWAQLWYPTRATQETGSSLVVAVGTYLVIRALLDPRSSRWMGAIGLAMALTKPQFGLGLLVLLLAQRCGRLVARGLAVVTVVSLPATVACLISAGGPIQWVESLIRDLQRASSPSSPTGLLSSEQERVDLVGLAVRLGAPAPPSVIEISITFAVLLSTAVLLARRPTPPAILGLYAIVPLLVFVHMPYDYGVLIVPALYFALRFREAPSVATGALMVLCVIPVIHIHRVSAMVGVSDAAASALDLVSLITAAIMIAVLSARREGNQFSRTEVSPDPGSA